MSISALNNISVPFLSGRPLNAIDQSIPQSTRKRVKVSESSSAIQTPLEGTPASIMFDQSNAKKSASRCAFKNLINVQQNLDARFGGQCF